MTLNELILHKATREQAARFVAAPSHALLLAGPDGSGKTTLAQALAAEALQIETIEMLATHPYVRTITPKNATTSIDAIRELQHFLQLKTTGQKPLRRLVLVEYAHTLSQEAQNAFLKLLEEPPKDTLLILTARSPRTLLPTIISRVQVMPVHPPDQADISGYFAGQGKDAAAIQRAYSLSGGLPGLMHALLDSHQEHPLLASVNQAKELLGQSVFERLAQVEQLSKHKDQTAHVLEALARIARVSIQQAAGKQDTRRLQQWHTILKQVNYAQTALQANANPKLTFTNLLLQL